jgi:hypothetical protein
MVPWLAPRRAVRPFLGRSSLSTSATASRRHRRHVQCSGRRLASQPDQALPRRSARRSWRFRGCRQSPCHCSDRRRRPNYRPRPPNRRHRHPARRTGHRRSVIKAPVRIELFSRARSRSRNRVLAVHTDQPLDRHRRRRRRGPRTSIRLSRKSSGRGKSHIGTRRGSGHLRSRRAARTPARAGRCRRPGGDRPDGSRHVHRPAARLFL